MLNQENKQNKSTTPLAERYFRPEINDNQIEKVVKIIRNKVVDYDECRLDQTILDAHIDELFFLGKLKELNNTVTVGRKKVNELVEEITKYMSTIYIVENSKHNFSMDKNLKDIVDKYMQQFTGRRFMGEIQRQYNKKLMISTQSHFITSMTRSVSNIFDSKTLKPEVDNLKSIGTLFFDLDGLKMLNDMSLGGYNSGDKALWVMARALTNPALINWAGEQGIELVPAHHHGDEFLMGVVAERNINLTDNNLKFKGVDGENVEGVSILKYIGEFIKNKIGKFSEEEQGWGNIETNTDIVPTSIRDIIDFSNPEQMKKFNRIKDSWFSKDAKLKTIFNKNFQYKLSCSYGYSTLEDAVARNIEDKLKFADNKISYEYIIYMLTGHGLVDTAEKKLKTDKGYGRKKRQSSNDPQDRLLENIYRTGRERRGGHINQEDYLVVEEVLLEFRDEVLELRNELVENQHEEALTLNEIFDIIKRSNTNVNDRLKAVERVIRGDNSNNS